MHMMMSVLDPGFLGLMSYMLMKGSFAAHHGHQERFVLGFDLFPEMEEANMNRAICS